MKRLFLFTLAAGMLINPIQVAAQSNNTPAFEHIHSLAMDADGRSLFLGAHTGVFRSDDTAAGLGKKWRYRRSTLISTS